MAERTVTVGSESGLHARPAALFVRAATKAPAKVTIRVGDGKAVDARSMLAVLSLGVKKGTAVTLSSSGEGSDEAVATLADLLERNLDEPDQEPQASSTSG